MEQQLITLSDLQQFRPIANLDEGRVGPFIIEAQECDLKPILNDAFYYYVVKNINNSAIQELIYGKEYEYQGVTYYFNGLVAVLAYYTLVRLIQSNQLNVTNFGVVLKNTQQSTPAEPAAIQAEVKSLRSAAIRYQEDLVLFLSRNKVTYPLWDTQGQDNNKGRRNAFNFFFS